MFEFMDVLATWISKRNFTTGPSTCDFIKLKRIMSIVGESGSKQVE